MRLINGDALIEKAKHEAEGMEEPYSTNLPVIIDWLVGKMPTEHPLHKNGRWIKKGAYWYCCSKCNEIVPDVRTGGWPYCPNCGADMRGEKDDQ